MSASLRVRVQSLALWATHLPGWPLAQAVIRGEQPVPAEASRRPSPALLAPTERRRAPDTVALALEVAARACEDSGHDPAALPSVFASTHGDLAITDYMCATLAQSPSLLSPIKFHNSVHNAAAGYWSIGTGSRAPYTAISAYVDTFGAGLLEAATQAACQQGPVLYVAFDIEAKGPLSAVAPSQGLLATAMVLAPAEAAGRELLLTMEPRAPLTIAASPAASVLAGNALSPCVPFLEAMAASAAAQVRLGLSRHNTLQVMVAEA